MSKKSSVVSPTITDVVPTAAVTTTICPFPSLDLSLILPTPSPQTVVPFFSPTITTCSNSHPLSPLLLISTVVAYSGSHTLPLLLLTPSPFSFILSLLLCTPVCEHVGKFDFKLSTAEFVYDTSVTRTIVKSPM